MYRFFTRPICLGLIAFACGSPGELDESRFPELGDTGYPDRVGAAGAGTGGPLGGSGGGSTGGSSTGGSSTGGSAGLGGSGTGIGGMTPGGGTGGSQGVAGAAGQSGSAGQSGGAGQAGSTGQGGTGVEPGCPSDILVLLNRPGPMGGCAGGGCHVPGGTPPDLTSPGIEARVLNVASTCQNLPYVGAEGSFIEDKITGAPPTCGAPMPLFAANMLNAADEACIIQWIDDLASGM